MKKHFILLFPLFLNTIIASAQYSWKQRANFGGIARYGAYGFSIDNFGYIGGGYNGSNLTDFWQFDPSTNSWTQKSNSPVALRAASTFVINGKGYLTGGLPNSGPLNASLYMYDPVANSWTGKASFPGAPRYGAGTFSIGNKGYFGVGNGGTASGPYYADFYEYDAVADTWTQKATFPGTPRYGTYGIALNGVGYYGFGYNYALGIFYNDWYEYDPSTDSWATKANFPGTPRHYIGGFTINNLIYAGTGNASNSEAVKDFYEYNTVADSWTQKQDYGAGNRWIVASFSIGNIGYFGTGSDASSNYYNEFWEYAPVAAPPIASFQTSDSTICANSCINFTDHSTGATSWQWSFPGATPSSSSDENPQNICYLAGGSYDITLIASNIGGSDTLTLANYIKVHPAPPTPVITQLSDTLVFTTDYSYASYQWYFNNSIVSGATDTFYIENGNGNYNVAVTDTNGCQISVGIIILGLNESKGDVNFSLYPNPVNNELTISIPKDFHKAKIEIYDATGRNLIQSTFDSVKDNKIYIDFSNLEEGIYFVSINIDGKKWTKRIVKNLAFK